MTFNQESLIGIPNIMDVYRSGNVAIVNAPGNGVADDKGIYYFVPKMIRYYLDQEPISKMPRLICRSTMRTENMCSTIWKSWLSRNVAEPGDTA